MLWYQNVGLFRPFTMRLGLFDLQMCISIGYGLFASKAIFFSMHLGLKTFYNVSGISQGFCLQNSVYLSFGHFTRCIGQIWSSNMCISIGNVLLLQKQCSQVFQMLEIFFSKTIAFCFQTL